MIVLAAWEPTIVWFTGLPASGKTTIADKLIAVIERQGSTALHLDSDNVRRGNPHEFGFDLAGRKAQGRYLISLADVAKYASGCDYILVSSISPFKDVREEARNNFAPWFIEVFLDVDRNLRFKRAKADDNNRWIDKGMFFEVDKTYEKGEADITLDGSKAPEYYAGLLYAFMEGNGLCRSLDQKENGEPIQAPPLSIKPKLRLRGSLLQSKRAKVKEEKRAEN